MSASQSTDTHRVHPRFGWGCLVLLLFCLLGTSSASAQPHPVVTARVEFARSVAAESARKAADALFSALSLLGEKDRIALARELKKDAVLKAALSDSRLEPLLDIPKSKPSLPKPQRDNGRKKKKDGKKKDEAGAKIYDF